MHRQRSLKNVGVSEISPRLSTNADKKGQQATDDQKISQVSNICFTLGFIGNLLKQTVPQYG